MDPRLVEPVKPVLALAVLLLAGCLEAQDAPVDASDPVVTAPADFLAMGPLGITSELYDFGLVVATDPSLVVYRYPVQMTGSIHFPANGEGPFPLVLLMHGRHGTCAILGIEGIGTHVCPNAMVVEPVDSFAGYDGLAANLASHGYVVASINANQVNDRDLAGDSGANARAEVALATIDALAGVNEAGGSGLDALQGRIDLTRIGLMGHSRGGEGMMRATTLNVERGDPYPIVALFALAPTDFARWELADGTAFATILPYCDGDVFNLQGGWMYDDARSDLAKGQLSLGADQVLAQVITRGANHNFYNTVWTGDDNGGSPDPWCGADESGNGRDEPEEQRAHGDALMASFFRAFVGGEAAFRSYWNGSSPWPAELCPGRDTCDDRLLLSTQSPAAVVLSLDGSDGTPAGGLSAERCTPPQCPGKPTFTVAAQTAIEGPAGGSLAYAVPAGAALGHGALTFRAGVPVGDDDVALQVHFVGADGTVEVVDVSGHPTLMAPPGGDGDEPMDAKTLLSMVRVPFPAGLDPAGLTEVRLVLATGGTLQVADVLLAD